MTGALWVGRLFNERTSESRVQFYRRYNHASDVVGDGSNRFLCRILSGADSATLLQEPQQPPDGLGASNQGSLQYADPSSQVDLVQPPVANNQGDAQVTFPISVPPGRAGVQPDLSLSYSSSAGNS